MGPEHWIYTIPLRLRSLFHWAQADQELDDELRDHLEQKTEEYVAQGMAPAQARRRARLDLGGIEQTKEKCRDTRRARWLQDLAQDLRYGVRMLRKSPGFAVIAILTLALGIGANTAIFSVVNAVLLRPLPYPESERIAQIGLDRRNGEPQPSINVPQFEFLRDHGGSACDAVAAYQGWNTLELKQQDKIDWVKTLRVSADFFRVLGVPPVLGREFTRAETEPGAPLSIILSDAVWRRSFDARPDIIGKQAKLDDEVYTVAGVLPRGFEFLGFDIGNSLDVYIPLQPSESLGDRGFNTYTIARLKPGVNLQQAQTAMTVLFPQLPDKSTNFLGITVVSYQRLLTWDIRPSLLVLFGAVGLLLLIACVNVASLILARTNTRTRELSIRLAVGADRGRLLWQLLAESLLVAAIGAGAGLAAAHWTLHTLVRAIPWELHAPADSIRLNATVLAFTLGTGILTSIVFGLASFWQAMRMNVSDGLKSSPTQGSGAAAHGRMRNALVVSETALSLMLLIGAALLAESLYHLHQEKLGFDPSDVVMMSVAYPKESGAVGERYWHLQQELLARIQVLPGVRSAAVANVVPLHGQGNLPTQLAGHNDAEHSIGGMEIRKISEQYFETMRIPILAGRGFLERDSREAPLVALVNETLARRWWKGKSPIGDQIIIGDYMGQHAWEPPPPAREVVGIVGDVKGMLLTRPAPPMVYIPVAQAGDMNAPGDWVIRAARGLEIGPALRQVISEADPESRITDLRTMSSVIGSAVAGQRFDTLLMGLFAGMALALASVGIYGVLNLYVSQRTREIGVRMALGAEARQVMRLVLGQGLLLAVLGVAIGAVAALWLTRFLSGLLYGVHATSVVPYAMGSLVLGVVALLASYIPARRAMRVDPMVALRYE